MHTDQQFSLTFDLIISNGRIVDGTGASSYNADVGIFNGKIAAIGSLSSAKSKRSINANGMVVAPGFIDMLGQSELSILANPHLPSKIFQGITSEFTGEGGSVAPLNESLIERDRAIFDKLNISPDWTSFDEYFEKLERRGLGINFGSYIGATQVRKLVLGDENRAPTNSELNSMKGIVSSAMTQGAVGLSTALQYSPAMYADTEELIALTAESARFNGMYATHLRSESYAIRTALAEAIRIGREAKSRVEIWHLKAAGKGNWGRMPEIVSQIDEARESGVDVSANIYPYPAWFNSLSSFVPPWACESGPAQLVKRLQNPEGRDRIKADIESTNSEWENQWNLLADSSQIMLSVVYNPQLLDLQGKTILQIAEDWRKEPLDVILDVLIKDPRAYVAAFGMSESDISFALQQPWVSICSDSQGTAPDGLLGKDHPHPRAYGSFPRILRKYVREEKVLSLEEAIRRFSSLPAQRMRLTDRGILKTGMWADLVVFDSETISDRATFEKPNQLSVGMEHVLVNGVPVISEGEMTNALPGKVLRHKQQC